MDGLDAGGVTMFSKSCLFAVAVVGCLAAPAPCFAQGAGDAGVSGIPRGPGSAGGLNNSVNDPSGIGNAARIPAPPPPSIAVPAVPSFVPAVSSRVSSRPAPVLRRAIRQSAVSSRREFRRSTARAARTKDKLLDSKLNICRGC
jgi:hypothetical protein